MLQYFKLEMSEGYVYAFSNPSMPGLLKVGITERTPDIRLHDANTSDTWRPPTLYELEIAKKVKNPREKEKTLHKLLEQYAERVHPRREFFRVSLEELRVFFDLMDGEMWNTAPAPVSEEEVEETYEEDETESTSTPVTENTSGCRDMTKCFTHGQRIRHVIGINKIWTGTYDSAQNGIVCDNVFYKSLSSFALAHRRIYNPSRKSTGGWKHCECERNGEWVSTFRLPG
jgi:hypothetical protein